MKPEDIAAMALLLISPEGARITGQALSVDDGYRLQGDTSDTLSPC